MFAEYPHMRRLLFLILVVLFGPCRPDKRRTRQQLHDARPLVHRSLGRLFATGPDLSRKLRDGIAGFHGLVRHPKDGGGLSADDRSRLGHIGDRSRNASTVKPPPRPDFLFFGEFPMKLFAKTIAVSMSLSTGTAFAATPAAFSAACCALGACCGLPCCG